MSPASSKTPVAPSGPPQAQTLRERLLETATELFRRQGFMATTVDEICAQTGATKGAFFHHFDSKEAVAEACLQRWNQTTAALIAGRTGRSDDPTKRVLAFMDVFIDVFSDPNVHKSCLAGTTVQEVSETHPRLREAANDCLTTLQDHMKRLLDDACRERRLKRDTAALATLWVATLQGALVVCKASGDQSVVAGSLKHTRAYIASQFESRRSSARRPPKR